MGRFQYEGDDYNLVMSKDEVSYYVMDEKLIVGYKVETGKSIHVQAPYKWTES